MRSIFGVCLAFVLVARLVECLRGGRWVRNGEFPFLVRIEKSNYTWCLGSILDSERIIVPDDCLRKSPLIGYASANVIPIVNGAPLRKYTGRFVNTDHSAVYTELDVIVIRLDPPGLELAEWHQQNVSRPKRVIIGRRVPGKSDVVVVGLNRRVGAMTILHDFECFNRLGNLYFPMNDRLQSTKVLLGEKLMCAVLKNTTGNVGDVPPGQACERDLGAPVIQDGSVVGVLVGVFNWTGHTAISLINSLQRSHFMRNNEGGRKTHGSPHLSKSGFEESLIRAPFVVGQDMNDLREEFIANCLRDQVVIEKRSLITPAPKDDEATSNRTNLKSNNVSVALDVETHLGVPETTGRSRNYESVIDGDAELMVVYVPVLSLGVNATEIDGNETIQKKIQIIETENLHYKGRPETGFSPSKISRNRPRSVTNEILDVTTRVPRRRLAKNRTGGKQNRIPRKNCTSEGTRHVSTGVVSKNCTKYSTDRSSEGGSHRNDLDFPEIQIIKVYTGKTTEVALIPDVPISESTRKDMNRTVDGERTQGETDHTENDKELGTVEAVVTVTNNTNYTVRARKVTSSSSPRTMIHVSAFLMLCVHFEFKVR